MHLYVDESGNTGGTLSNNNIFNFSDQPIYALAGILPGNNERALVDFTGELIKRYKIFYTELKAKNIYERKPRFIIDLVDYLTSNKIPSFIELMDKVYYLNIQITTHFISPPLQVTNFNIARNNHIASTLGNHLTEEIYHAFIRTCKDYHNESLEEFYHLLIDHFDTIEHYEYKGYVQLLEARYLDIKSMMLKEL